MGTEGSIEREKRFFVDGREEKRRNDDPKHIVRIRTVNCYRSMAMCWNTTESFCLPSKMKTLPEE